MVEVVCREKPVVGTERQGCDLIWDRTIGIAIDDRDRVSYMRSLWQIIRMYRMIAFAGIQNTWILHPRAIRRLKIYRFHIRVNLSKELL